MILGYDTIREKCTSLMEIVYNTPPSDSIEMFTGYDILDMLQEAFISGANYAEWVLRDSD